MSHNPPTDQTAPRTENEASDDGISAPYELLGELDDICPHCLARLELAEVPLKSGVKTVTHQRVEGAQVVEDTTHQPIHSGSYTIKSCPNCGRIGEGAFQA